MKCLIIAAGKGSRLQHRGDSKPLIPILGIPLIERVIRTVLEAGAEEFYVVIDTTFGFGAAGNIEKAKCRRCGVVIIRQA